MMPKLTTPMLASIGAMVMVGTLFLSFYVSTSAYRAGDTTIVLPGEATGAPVADTGLQQVYHDGLGSVQITTENIRQVVASLSRPAAYSYTVKNTLYYGEQSFTVSRRQTVLNGVCRTDELDASGSIVRSMLQSGDAYYTWRTGSSTYYTGAAGAFTSDMNGMLLTYEDVVGLPADAITDAGTVNLDYEPCVFASALTGAYRSVYYVSTTTGLLRRVDIYQGEQLIRRSEVTDLSTEQPFAAAFMLPGGTLVDTGAGSEGT